MSDDDTRGPKERAYDQHVYPLMAGVIQVCEDHGIAAFATFVLDLDEDGAGSQRCTTLLHGDRSDPAAEMLLADLRRLAGAP